ncbi:MAG: GNAT family N-acetyltransferase [Hyphomicrobiales bacterium]
MLLAWRNDPETRRMRHHGEEVRPRLHFSWLDACLRDPDRRLYIAEIDAIPVGTVRADHADGVWELSWTVAPAHRSRGVGKDMIAEAARLIAGPIRAEVKAGNLASIRIAEGAEMRRVREADGVAHLARPAVAKTLSRDG